MPIVNIHLTRSADRQLLVALTARDNSNGPLLPGTSQQSCTIPQPSTQLLNKALQWQQVYPAWLKGVISLAKSPPIDITTNATVLRECQQIGQELIYEFNQWINYQNNIQNALLKILPPLEYSKNPSDFCFILRINTGDEELDLTLQRLPFDTCNFIQESYPDAEIAISTKSHALPAPVSGRLKVLVILGDDPKIDFTPHQAAIGQNLSPDLADVQYWSCQLGSQYTALKSNRGAIPDLFATLRDCSPQVLIFIGHSESTVKSSAMGLNQNAPIRIWINEHEFISPQDRNFKDILTGLKNRGLIFAAFVSCDGLGIACELNNLGIPYLMVSREILPVHVAKDFLDEFLAKATQPGVPIHVALSYARRHLRDNVEASVENGCPNASTFPVIFQIPEQHSYILNPINSKVLPLPPEGNTKPVTILDKFRLVFNTFSKKVWIFLLCFGFGIAAVIYLPRLAAQPLACDANSQNLGYLSCGEESILDNIYLPSQHQKLDQQARQGMQALKDGNYKQAIIRLETAWAKDKHNPEVLIALNNAIARSKSPAIPIKNIAILIPAGDTIEPYIAISLLSAVAEAQTEWNQVRRKNDWLLQVTIANDYNEPSKAINTVAEIIKRKDIIGTVGPYSSYVAEEVVDKYNKNSHTLISGTTTSTNLTNKNPYFLRTANSNDIQVKHLIKHLLDHQISRIELLHGTKPFSLTFMQGMERQAMGRIVINKLDISKRDLNIRNQVFRLARDHNSQALVLIPDAFVKGDRDHANIRQILANNPENIPIIGNEVVNSPWLIDQIEQDKEIAKNLSLTLTWDQSVDRNKISSSFINAPKWMRDKSNHISHRVALTYDATKVLLAAIDLGVNQGKNDSEIKQDLPMLVRKLQEKEETTVIGMTGKITFQKDKSDRAEELDGFVQPKIGADGKFQGFKPPDKL